MSTEPLTFSFSSFCHQLEDYTVAPNESSVLQIDYGHRLYQHTEHWEGFTVCKVYNSAGKTECNHPTSTPLNLCSGLSRKDLCQFKAKKKVSFFVALAIYTSCSWFHSTIIHFQSLVLVLMFTCMFFFLFKWRSLSNNFSFRVFMRQSMSGLTSILYKGPLESLLRRQCVTQTSNSQL